MRIPLTILFTTFIFCVTAQTKYPANSIPEDMTQGMYAVVRESESRFYIDNRGQSSQYVRKVITILNSKANYLAEITVDYDKLKKVDVFKASVYDAAGNQIKKLKHDEIIDQSAISGFSLF